MAQVRHSQSVTVPPLHPWIAAEKNGTILCAQCTCKAGLREACSHISALLFAAETHKRLKKDNSCTSQLCAWLPPSMQDVKFVPISDINFIAPATKRKKLSPHHHSNVLAAYSEHSETRFTAMPSPSTCKEELAAFYQHLSQTGKPALLSILPDYSDSYAEDCMLSDPLPTLFKEELIALKYDDLLLICEMTFNSLSITEDQAKQKESATCDQVHSKLWFCYSWMCHSIKV